MKTHTLAGKTTTCGLKTKRPDPLRIVEERPSCNRCRKMRSVLRVGKLDRCTGHWTSKGWVTA